MENINGTMKTFAEDFLLPILSPPAGELRFFAPGVMGGDLECHQ